jgi:hypothetical protein
MLLGDVLARFDDEAFAAETVLRVGDVGMLARMQKQAAEEGESLGSFARSAVQRFAAAADDEAWVSLLGALARTQDPGAVCLTRAFAYVSQNQA